MKHIQTLGRTALIAIALAGGLVEFASLQRWRVKAWMGRGTNAARG
jgi:hypothetical protein